MQITESRLRELISQVIAEAKPKKKASKKRSVANELAHEAAVVLNNDVINGKLLASEYIERAMVEIIEEMLDTEQATDAEIERCTINALNRVDWASLLKRYLVPQMTQAIYSAAGIAVARRASRGNKRLPPAHTEVPLRPFRGIGL